MKTKWKKPDLNGSLSPRSKNVDMQFGKTHICKHLIKNLVGTEIVSKSTNPVATKPDGGDVSVPPIVVPGQKKSSLSRINRSNSGGGYNINLGTLPNGKPIEMYMRSDPQHKETFKVNEREVRNMQSPLYAKSPKSKKHSIATNFVRDQQQGKVKLGYTTIFKSKDHHIVTGKGQERSTFSVFPNTTIAGDQTQKQKTMTLSFEKCKPRPGIVKDHFSPRWTHEKSFNENRFENINKDPKICSKINKSMEFSFDKQLDRSGEKHRDFGPDYDIKVPSITNSIPHFDRSPKRLVGEGYGGYIPTSVRGLSNNLQPAITVCN